MTEGPAPCRSALGSYPAAAAPIAYASLTLSVLGPTGIDPSLPDCCPCRYSIARDAGSTCVAALPVPMARASSAAPVAPAVASAATLLVLPMSAPHAAKGTPPLPVCPRRMRLPPVVRGGGGRRLGSVSWLADQRLLGRLPGRSPSRWEDGGRLAAHNCATARDSNRIPVTRSVIQMSRSSMRRALADSSRGRWVHLRPCPKPARGRSPSSPCTPRHCRIWAAERTAG